MFTNLGTFPSLKSLSVSADLNDFITSVGYNVAHYMSNIIKADSAFGERLREPQRRRHDPISGAAAAFRCLELVSLGSPSQNEI
jgi:hypothetical protein